MSGSAPLASPGEAAEAHTGEKSSATVKTLAKGLAILELIMQRGSVRTIDVASELRIDKGSASRLLHTLLEGGFAAKGEGRAYHIGPKLTLASVRRMTGAKLRENARPLLQELVDIAKESAHLCILVDDQVLYIDRIDSASPLRVDRPIGTFAPLHCTALGKIFLAFGEAPLPADMRSATARTLTDPELLKAHLRQVASQGYAVDDEEFCMGIRCVAAPLRDNSGRVVAALGISGPTARINLDYTRDLGELVCRVSKKFSLG